MYTREDRFVVPAFRVAVVSTAGAGDAFDAGYIAGRLRGASLERAGVYANAVAAIKVTHETSQAVPSHPEVLAFLAERGISVPLDN